MKILGQRNKVVNGKPYYRHWINIPNKLLISLDWKVGDELDPVQAQDQLLLRRRTKDEKRKT